MLNPSQNINIRVSKNIFNPVYLPLLECNERFIVLYGGAGSGKSVFGVQKMIWKALKNPNRRILVIRKTQVSIKDSIYKEIENMLGEGKRKGHGFQITHKCKFRRAQSPSIVLPNGSEFIFRGLDDPEKIKSISGIDDILIEEATELEQSDFDQLNLRLRSKAENQQIVLMFNPVSKANWCYQRWFVDKPENTRVLHTTYLDNIDNLPEAYIQNFEQMKRLNPDYYEIYALGKFGNLGKLIFNNITYESCRDRQENRFIGIDYGFSNDPTAIVVCNYDSRQNTIHIIDEHYEKGMFAEDIVRAIEKMSVSHLPISSESSDPRMIAELKRLGLRVHPVKKGPDSINYGINWLQSKYIFIDPSLEHMKTEAENYTWMQDRDGVYINKPIDKFNHLWDAVRYAFEATMLHEQQAIKSINRASLGLGI